jgi:hypothetical protein
VGLKITVPSCPSTQTDHENDLDLSPTTNSGIVREFCPGLNEYFVIFEESSLPPTWISLHDSNHTLKDDVQVVIDWDRTMQHASLPTEGQCPGDDSDEENEQEIEISKSNETFNDKHQPLNSDEIVDEVTPTTNDEIVSDSSPVGIEGHHLVVSEPTKSTKRCELCGEGDEDVQDCPKCGNHSCHPACMPLSKLETQIDECWRCWHCIGE